MYRQRVSCRTIIISVLQVTIGAIVLFSVACWRIGGELPTRVPTAEVPPQEIAGFTQLGTLPATYTPASSGPLMQPAAAQPGYVGTPVATSTLPPALMVPQPPMPPTITPTPFKAPAYLLRQVNVLEYEKPPFTTECDDTGVVFRSRYPSGIGGPWRYYHAYLPPCYGQDGRVYPVVYLLHGSRHTDYQWVRLGVAQHIDQGILEGRYPPFIAIMPYHPDFNDTTSGGERSVEGVTMDYLIPFVDQNFCTWTTAEGRSLSGISRGGYWALMLAFRYTDMFGAVAGHSSQLRLDVDPPRHNPRATYAEADLSNLKIWLDWGEYDFLRNGQYDMHISLMDAGIAHRVSVNPGGHSDLYWYEHVHQYMDWHAANWPVEREAYPFCQLATTN
jgi:enterochelin esterase-like enzyme